MDSSMNDALQTKCPSCGGMMAYSPKRKMLECVYCGSTKELDLAPVEVKENRFDEWAEQSDEDLTQQTVATLEVKCQQCGAFTSLPADKSSATCAFCGTPLITQDAQARRFWQPNYILPFEFPKEQCSENFNKWLKSKWFAPSKLRKGGVQADNFKGVYLPFWTYDAETTTDYVGERGKDRTVTEKDKDGKTTSHTETTWTRTEGTVDVSFDDVIVPGTKTLPDNILYNLDNWDLSKLVPYNPEFLAGFVTDLYTIDFREGLGHAKEKMKSEIESEIETDIGGDKQRIIEMHTDYQDVMFKLLLLPLWISVFHFNGKTYQFVVNGKTGEITGDYPYDKFKVALCVILFIIVCALGYYWLYC